MPGPVNVCFSTQPNALLSKLIRWLTRSPASHCLLTFYDATLDKVLVMHADRGFQVAPWGRWIKQNTLVARYALEVPEPLQVDALHKLADYLGCEYDTTSFLGFLWRRWKKRYANPWSSSSKLICSEAVAMYLKDIGLPVEDPSTYTPADVWELMRGEAAVTLVESDGTTAA